MRAVRVGWRAGASMSLVAGILATGCATARPGAAPDPDGAATPDPTGFAPGVRVCVVGDWVWTERDLAAESVKPETRTTGGDESRAEELALRNWLRLGLITTYVQTSDLRVTIREMSDLFEQRAPTLRNVRRNFSETGPPHFRNDAQIYNALLMGTAIERFRTRVRAKYADLEESSKWPSWYVPGADLIAAAARALLETSVEPERARDLLRKALAEWALENPPGRSD